MAVVLGSYRCFWTFKLTARLQRRAATRCGAFAKICRLPDAGRSAADAIFCMVKQGSSGFNSESRTRAQPRHPDKVLPGVQRGVLYQLDIRRDRQVFGELQPVVLIARIRAEQRSIRPVPVQTESEHALARRQCSYPHRRLSSVPTERRFRRRNRCAGKDATAQRTSYCRKKRHPNRPRYRPRCARLPARA